MFYGIKKDFSIKEDSTLAAKAPVKRNLSAEKRARQAEARNARNRAAKSTIKGAVKAVETSVKANDKDAAVKTLQAAIKTISSAKSKGILHRNTAARKISRLAKKTNELVKA
ncbi:MAG: 30S ribosomal protein S20 [Nitrospirae bacterium]|nr:30S ribosomal protein S20 [Nitrospirota bacterium]